jgi:hypothetical protein
MEPSRGRRCFRGLIHAREWIAGEVATRLFEKMVLEYGTNSLVTYLVDSQEIVCLPIHNPDGFLQSQRYFNQSVSGDDGRMRRKNMRNGVAGQVDEILSTFGDYLRGTDLNRNHLYGFGVSSDPNSIIYNGLAPGSDAESQAMYVAAALVDPTRLRFYTDFHSFGEDIYYINTGNSNRDPVAFQLADRMSDVYGAIGGNAYFLIPVNVGGEIGATDEYFSHEFQSLGMTVELPSGSVDGGFVMANSEIAAAVAENIEAHLFAFYFAAGPPIMERVVFWQDDNADARVQSAEVAYDSYWGAKTNGIERVRATRKDIGLLPGESYKVWIRFSKPMRRDLGGGTASKWPGIASPIEPTVSASIPLAPSGSMNVSATGGAWLGAAQADGLSGGVNAELADSSVGWVRYPFDAWTGTLAVPANGNIGGTIAFTLRAQDMYGHQLDGLPDTVADWSAGWIKFENGTNPAQTNAGGTDLNHSTLVAADVPVEISAFGLE